MKYRIYTNTNRKYDNRFHLNDNFEDALSFHRSLPFYNETPLLELHDFAEKYGIKNLCIKDESKRFGLNAFKGLGVSYAVSKINSPDAVFVSCTDGNHGKALAWYSNLTNHKCYIFMPGNAEQRRIDAIKKYGAEVMVKQLNYDDTVRFASRFANENNYILVQDQAFEGYTDIPENIMLGYSTLIIEALEQMKEKPTHVFIQAGVGSLAGGVCWYMQNKMDTLPYIGIIESSVVPCIYNSIKENRFCSIGGEPETIMAGLNCGEPNIISLPILKHCAEWCIQCDDDIALQGMELSRKPIGSDPVFSCGECGAVSLGFLRRIFEDSKQAEMQMDKDSVILIINTEGNLE